MIGKTFGKLTVVAVSSRQLVSCKCACGNEHTVRARSVIRGLTRSCGCLIRETASRPHPERRTHGMSGASEYNIWRTMIARCRNPNHIRYAIYGGRGIKVCERWQSFENFYADMGPRPSPGHSIERGNNDGDYEPGNCRWADRFDQGRNKSNNRLLTHAGRTQTISEWSREVGIPFSVIRGRLLRGWSVARSLDPERARPGAKPGNRNAARKVRQPNGDIHV